MGKKLKFILSDLHLGAGHASDDGNILEDFLADQQLVDFVHEIRAESSHYQCEIELIINGDFFDFLQVPAVNYYDPAQTYPAKAYFDSSQEASVQRLNIIAQGHAQVFNALSDFMHVESPQRRITVIKGNHDVNLFWPGVKGRLREILGASGTRASLLLFADEFVSREKIYVEHGHQQAEKFNAYEDFFNPRRPDDPTQLHYPAGSRFIIDSINAMEPGHWFVDNIKPITTFIWHAFYWDFDFACQILINFVHHIETDGRKHSSTLKELLQDLEDEEKRKELAKRYNSDQAFRQKLHQQLHRFLDVVPVNSGDAPTLPPLSSDPLDMARINQRQQHLLLRRTAEQIAEREGARVLVFGHTHCAKQDSLHNGAVYINSGCWTEDFSQASPETWQDLFSGTRKPNAETIKFPYVRIEYDDDNIPTGQLLFFNADTPSEQKQDKKSEKGNWLTRLWGRD